MFHLAIRNTLFYRGRSIATVVLTFVSALFFIIYVSLMDGSHNAMLQNSLKVYRGAIEIYHKGYRDMGGNEYLIRDVESITKKLEHIEGIEVYTPRYETYGLLSSKEKSTASMIVGINPNRERELNKLSSALTKGRYIDSVDNCLYSGVDLINKLNAKIGDEIAFIGSASDNSFSADIFKLCGIFKTGLFEFDATASFIHKEYFDRLMYSKNMASYITLKIDNLKNAERINRDIEKSIDRTQYESLTWKTLMSSMVELLEVDSIFGYISLSLFFVVIFFVIMIYGFINISSRIKEFGVLRSIGLSQANIRKLLLYEIFILSTTAILLALPIGAYTAYYFSLHPIIIEGISETYKQYGIVSDEMPFAFDIFTISWNVLVIYLLNFLSIIYPIIYINSFKPIEATRHF